MIERIRVRALFDGTNLQDPAVVADLESARGSLVDHNTDGHVSRSTLWPGERTTWGRTEVRPHSR